jgi:hypothetical protein
MTKILIMGELILDTTAPVCLPYKTRTVRRRIEPIVYQQLNPSITRLGGIFYLGRFLSHFCNDVIALFPRPLRDPEEKVEKLFTSMNTTHPNISRHPIRIDNREVYEAKRFVEVGDINYPPDWAKGHAFVRLDSGSIDPMTPDQLNGVVNELEDILVKNRNHLSCIVLTDYDLGLFTPQFIERISRCVSDQIDNTIPIVVYSGRRWRKYAAFENCWIVTEASEAEDEFAGMDIIDNPGYNEFDQFRHIAARYPSIRGFVLVDGKKSLIASWNFNRKLHSINLEAAIHIIENGTYRTPVGHRALIAAVLALQLAEEKKVIGILPKAHKIANYNGAVLIDEFSGFDTNKILGEENGIGVDINASQSLIIEISAPEIFHEQLLNDNLILRLSKAQTAVHDYYTCDEEFRENINNFVRQIKDTMFPKCTINSHVFQKVHLWGPSGSGKSAFAELLQKQLTGSNDILNLASPSFPKNPGEEDKAAKMIMDYIEKWDNDAEWNVRILDEFDKLDKIGSAVQSRVFTDFSDKETSISKPFGLIAILTSLCSTEKQFKNNTSGNLSDFYSRFKQARFYVPDFAERPLDAAYLFASVLYKHEIHEVSLKGIISVVNYKFTNPRDLIQWANKLVSQNKNNGQIGDEAFKDLTKKRKKLPFLVADKRYVTIIN